MQLVKREDRRRRRNYVRKTGTENEDIREFGQVALNNNRENNRISLLTIIGEIEGHDCLPATTKTTKYEHVLPKLAEMEDNRDTEGILLLLNTVGGALRADSPLQR